jgi:hypothetical protein
MSFDDLIIPNDKSPLDQSNIFKDVEFPLLKKPCLGILLTPVCDLAHNKSNAIFCPVVDYVKFFPFSLKQSFGCTVEDLKKGKCKKDTEDKIKNGLIENFLNNRHNTYHWLGKLPGKTSFWYVDFRVVGCFNLKDITIDNRVAVTKSPLRESVPAMYSNFMNRVGLPWEKEDRLKFAETILAEIKKS